MQLRKTWALDVVCDKHSGWLVSKIFCVCVLKIIIAATLVTVASMWQLYYFKIFTIVF